MYVKYCHPQTLGTLGFPTAIASGFLSTSKSGLSIQGANQATSLLDLGQLVIWTTSTMLPIPCLRMPLRTTYPRVAMQCVEIIHFLPPSEPQVTSCCFKRVWRSLATLPPNHHSWIVPNAVPTAMLAKTKLMKQLHKILTSKSINSTICKWWTRPTQSKIKTIAFNITQIKIVMNTTISHPKSPYRIWPVTIVYITGHSIISHSTVISTQKSHNVVSTSDRHFDNGHQHF